MKNAFKLLSWLVASVPVLALVSVPFQASAQTIEMAEVMRSNGKIYVVVGVIAIIFIGLVVYLITLDRRLTKIEKEEK